MVILEENFKWHLEVIDQVTIKTFVILQCLFLFQINAIVSYLLFITEKNVMFSTKMYKHFHNKCFFVS